MGCETIQDGFVGEEVEDVTPFAQKTVEVLGVQNIQVRDDEFIYLRFLIDDDFVELDELQAGIARVDLFRDQVIAYSVDLVRVTELYSADADRVRAYADGIDKQLRESFVGGGVATAAEWDSLMGDIRAQPDLLAALRTAQPLINTAGAFYEELIREIETVQLDAVRTEFDRRILAEYSSVLEYIDAAYATRDEALSALASIELARRGDTDAWERLQSSPAARGLKSNDPNSREVAELQTALEADVARFSGVLQNLDQDVDDYKTNRAELDRLESEVLSALEVARLQFLTWSRSHQALASGIRNPAKWMELSVQAAQLAGKAL